ncbi:hypothetical protein B0H11DRAFT_2198008 [Mycena galericulata]|nr:hypothetical protein B0H11DRAFT_2198008 [Mycena galericulata]
MATIILRLQSERTGVILGHLEIGFKFHTRTADLKVGYFWANVFQTVGTCGDSVGYTNFTLQHFGDASGSDINSLLTSRPVTRITALALFFGPNILPLSDPDHQILDQTPPNTPQRARIASQRHERENRVLDSPQHHRLPQPVRPNQPQAPAQQLHGDVFGGGPANRVQALLQDFNLQQHPIPPDQRPRLTPNTMAAVQDRLAQLQTPLEFNPVGNQPTRRRTVVPNAVAGPSNAHPNPPPPPPRVPQIPPRLTPNTVAAAQEQLALLQAPLEFNPVELRRGQRYFLQVPDDRIPDPPNPPAQPNDIGAMQQRLAVLNVPRPFQPVELDRHGQHIQNVPPAPPLQQQQQPPIQLNNPVLL